MLLPTPGTARYCKSILYSLNCLIDYLLTYICYAVEHRVVIFFYKVFVMEITLYNVLLVLSIYR